MNKKLTKEQREHEKYKRQLFKSIRKRRASFEAMWLKMFGEPLWSDK